MAETNLARIHIGQSATIQADAYPGRTFEAQVIQIAAQSVVENNVTSFEIKLSLSDPQQLLRSGMNVDVTFNGGTKKQVLVVPTAAIVRQDKTQGVYVITNSEPPKFISITTGITANDKTEVRSGLVENERILLSFPRVLNPSLNKVLKHNHYLVLHLVFSQFHDFKIKILVVPCDAKVTLSQWRFNLLG